MRRREPEDLRHRRVFHVMGKRIPSAAGIAVVLFGSGLISLSPTWITVVSLLDATSTHIFALTGAPRRDMDFLDRWKCLSRNMVSVGLNKINLKTY